MINRFQWVINGISLYFDNCARYFQPVALVIRIPAYFMAMLAVMLPLHFIVGKELGYSSIEMITILVCVAVGLSWFGVVVFKYPPDDTGSSAP